MVVVCVLSWWCVYWGVGSVRFEGVFLADPISVGLLVACLHADDSVLVRSREYPTHAKDVPGAEAQQLKRFLRTRPKVVDFAFGCAPLLVRLELEARSVLVREEPQPNQEVTCHGSAGRR